MFQNLAASFYSAFAFITPNVVGTTRKKFFLGERSFQGSCLRVEDLIDPLREPGLFGELCFVLLLEFPSPEASTMSISSAASEKDCELRFPSPKNVPYVAPILPATLMIHSLEVREHSGLDAENAFDEYAVRYVPDLFGSLLRVYASQLTLERKENTEPKFVNGFRFCSSEHLHFERAMKLSRHNALLMLQRV